MEARAFLFEQSFDEPGRKKGPVKPAPEPTITLRAHEEKLRAADADAYERGRQAGRDQAEADYGRALDERLAEGIAALRTEIPRLDDELTDILKQTETRATRAILTLISHFAPALNQATAHARVQRLVDEALVVAQDEPELLIACAPDIHPHLEKHLAGRASQKACNVTVTADESLPGSSVHVQWRTGAVSWSPADVDDEIEALVSEANASLGT